MNKKNTLDVIRKGGRMNDPKHTCPFCRITGESSRELRYHQRNCDAREGEKPEEKRSPKKNSSSLKTQAKSEIKSAGDEVKTQIQHHMVEDHQPLHDMGQEKHHSAQRVQPANVLHDPQVFQKHKKLSPVSQDFIYTRKERLNLPKPSDKIWTEVNKELEEALNIVLPKKNIEKTLKNH